jgi:hypothetical protein
MYKSLYTHVKRKAKIGLPQWVAIHEKPPLRCRGTPHLNCGDLVVWERSSGKQPHWLKMKILGTVIDVRWRLDNWYQFEDTPVCYVPEAVVLWNDSEITYSSQLCLESVSTAQK